jgi:hypothetical protein
MGPVTFAVSECTEDIVVALAERYSDLPLIKSGQGTAP